MRILFYEDPLTDQNSFIWRSPHIILDSKWLNSLSESGADVRMLCHSRFAEIALKNNIPLSNLITIEEDILRNLLLYPQQNINSDFQRFADFSGDYGEIIGKIADSFGNIIKKAIGDFVPDVIITWVPVPFLRDIFPDALIMHKETGMLNRPPYPLTYYLDPFGFLNNSALRKEEIVKENHNLEAIAMVNNHLDVVRHEFANDLYEIDELFAKTSEFRERILLANHTNGVFFFDAVSEYRSQAHVVFDVLENIPPDTALIVSEHPDCLKLRSDEIELIQSKYPNFFCWSHISAIPRSGQKLVSLVDKVVTISSSVGLQALLWDKPLISLGNSHLNSFAAGVGASAINEAKKNNFTHANAAWLIFNYSIFNDLCDRPDYLYNRLASALRKWREGNPKAIFENEANNFKLTSGIINSRANLTVASNAEKFEGGAIDFFDNKKFGRGWNLPEEHGGLKYRWIIGKNAELKIRLNKTRYRLKILACTHVNCDDGQSLTVEINGKEYANTEISTAKTSVLDFVISTSDIGDYETIIKFKAAKSELPYENGPNLSLLISSLEFTPLTDGAVQNYLFASNIGKTRLEKPRHSILIPTLNGGETLKTVIPSLLEAIPDDCEILISDNHSSDDTWDVINSFKDQRIVAIRPHSRIDYGSNADFCYANSSGLWLSHIGDDDTVNKNRFELIDKVASYDDNIEVIFGSRLRYFWADFPDVKLANRLDPVAFDNDVIIDDGKNAAQRLINSINIRHTGAVVLKKQLIERVRYHNNGVFMQARLGEYYTYRIATGLAQKIAFLNQPLAIIGRHQKSIGTSMHHSEKLGIKYQVDTEREIGTIHEGTGFDFKGQTPFSFEAALKARNFLQQFYELPEMDLIKWIAACMSDLNNQKIKGGISEAQATKIEENAKTFWLSKNISSMPSNLEFGCPSMRCEKIGWQKPIYGEKFGFYDIYGLAMWFANNNPDAIELLFHNINDISPEEIELTDG